MAGDIQFFIEVRANQYMGCGFSYLILSVANTEWESGYQMKWLSWVGGRWSLAWTEKISSLVVFCRMVWEIEWSAEDMSAGFAWSLHPVSVFPVLTTFGWHQECFIFSSVITDSTWTGSVMSVSTHCRLTPVHTHTHVCAHTYAHTLTHTVRHMRGLKETWNGSVLCFTAF